MLFHSPGVSGAHRRLMVSASHPWRGSEGEGLGWGRPEELLPLDSAWRKGARAHLGLQEMAGRQHQLPLLGAALALHPVRLNHPSTVQRAVGSAGSKAVLNTDNKPFP